MKDFTARNSLIQLRLPLIDKRGRSNSEVYPRRAKMTNEEGKTMYGLPKDFNAERLVRRTLEMICFSENQIYFPFDEKLTIQVESSLRYQYQPTHEPEMIDVPALQSNLMQLLGHSTARASGDDKGTLTLEFEDGQILECLDDTPM
jgi:hypothetical protein